MSELKDIAQQQVTEEPQPVWKHKIFAAVIVVLVLYVVYCCVFQRFMVFAFMNNITRGILTFLNKIVLFFSKTIRIIFSWF